MLSFQLIEALALAKASFGQCYNLKNMEFHSFPIHCQLIDYIVYTIDACFVRH